MEVVAASRNHLAIEWIDTLLLVQLEHFLCNLVNVPNYKYKL